MAVLNFLAQMSWDPGEGERIYSMEEIVRRFSLTGVSKSNPVFDMTKLEWFNGKLISESSAKDLAPFVREELKKTGLWKEKLEREEKEWFFRFIDLLKERSRTLSDFSRRGRPFLSDDFEYEQEAVEKFLEDSSLSSLIEALQKDFLELSDFSAQETEQCLRKRAAAEGVKAALLIHATRVLVLGMAVSPSLFDVLGLLGKETTVQRLRQIHRFVPVR